VVTGELPGERQISSRKLDQAPPIFIISRHSLMRECARREWYK